MSPSEPADETKSAPGGERFRLASEFASADLEKQYRLSQLANSRVAAKWCIIAVIIASGLFLTADYRLFGPSIQFNVLVGVRALSIVLSVVALALVRRTQSPNAFNAILWSWTMMV